MAYAAVGDLLTGGIPTPAYLSTQKYVDDAADEIDSHIGLMYATPIDVTDVETNPVVRPVRLLLKRINTYLATGRLIMAATSNGEDDNLHAYGLSLVQEATAALKAISSGEIVLTGVDPADPDAQARVTGPIIANVDSESNVEAFYDRIANPNYTFARGVRYINPDTWVR